MSILAANRIHQLVDAGVVTGLHENVNAASLDVRIGNTILREKPGNHDPVDINAKQSPDFEEITIPEEGLVIYPGEAFLAHTVEFFNLPDTISAKFVLRSSMGRCFLNHMLAGFCDAGWNGAQLTMEFVNQTKYHPLLIKPGMRVGQIYFFEHESAGDHSYALVGNYNNQKGATKAFEGEGHVAS